MTESELAERILSLVGGPGNVVRITHCFSRLRFILHDDDRAQDAEIGTLPGVVMVLRQGGQVQVALRSGLLPVFDAVTGSLTP
jgi:beta-glucoside PTS system EIICBA component